tara:strand:+ start:773 stop:2500 length:1728 start_codon:yes stop_codon:yes gene_type:complete
MLLVDSLSDKNLHASFPQDNDEFTSWKITPFNCEVNHRFKGANPGRDQLALLFVLPPIENILADNKAIRESLRCNTCQERMKDLSLCVDKDGPIFQQWDIDNVNPFNNLYKCLKEDAVNYYKHFNGSSKNVDELGVIVVKKQSFQRQVGNFEHISPQVEVVTTCDLKLIDTWVNHVVKNYLKYTFSLLEKISRGGILQTLSKIIELMKEEKVPYCDTYLACATFFWERINENFNKMPFQKKLELVFRCIFESPIDNRGNATFMPLCKTIMELLETAMEKNDPAKSFVNLLRARLCPTTYKRATTQPSTQEMNIALNNLGSFSVDMLKVDEAVKIFNAFDTTKSTKISIQTNYLSHLLEKQSKLHDVTQFARVCSQAIETTFDDSEMTLFDVVCGLSCGKFKTFEVLIDNMSLFYAGLSHDMENAKDKLSHPLGLLHACMNCHNIGLGYRKVETILVLGGYGSTISILFKLKTRWNDKLYPKTIGAPLFSDSFKSEIQRICRKSLELLIKKTEINYKECPENMIGVGTSVKQKESREFVNKILARIDGKVVKINLLCKNETLKQCPKNLQSFIAPF